MMESTGNGRASAEPARRRYLTLAFCDLSDSTALSASMEAEHYADMLADLYRACQDVMARHGGTIVRIQGDGLLVMFGYPDAREDDGRRAVEASLDLHEAVGRLRVQRTGQPPEALSLHTGIHAGLVLLNDGDLVRGRFELLGNVPNIAARLCAEARRHEIVVSEETLGAERHFFETSEREWLNLKGRADALSCVRVLRRAAVQTRFEARTQRGLAPFVGRQPQLEQLDAMLRDARSGHPRHAVIEAAPGVGKTRLAEEFLRRAADAGWRVCRGYCESYLGAEPLQPFAQMLRAWFGLNAAAGAPSDRAAAVAAVDALLTPLGAPLQVHRAALLSALGLDPAGSGQRQDAPGIDATVLALGALFAAMAQQQPLLVFIDDGQWADEVSRRVLDRLRTVTERPLFTLCANRPMPRDEAGAALAAGTEVIGLPPFDEAEADATIHRLLPGVDPFIAEEIRRHAGGNALFIEELCHAAAYDHAVQRRAEAPDAGAWLDGLIESRLARLPRDQREVLRAAAVIGNVVPRWLLEALAGTGADEPMLQDLAAQDFLFPSDQADVLRFKHGITRDVVYAAIGLHERRTMHLRTAIALRKHGAGAEQDVYEALAYHYGEGGSGEEATHYAELAGDKAVRASALDRAQRLYRVALLALDPLGSEPDAYRRWMSIAQRLAMVCVFDPSRQHLDLLRRAAALAEERRDAVRLARAQYGLGYIEYALGEPRVAVQHCERALNAVGPDAADPLAVQIRATLGQARAAAGDHATASALLDEAIAVKRHHRSGSRPAVGLSYSLACQAGLLGDQGHFEASHALFDDALDAVRGAEHEVEASVLGWRCLVWLWQGRWDEALADAREAQRVAARVKSKYIYAMNQALAARALWMRDADPGAVPALRDATGWLEAGDRRLNISLNYAWLAEAALHSDQLALLRTEAARALSRARRSDRLGRCVVHRTLARAAGRAGDHAQAQRQLRGAQAAAGQRQSPHEQALNHLCAGELAQAQGQRAAAAAELDQALRLLDRLGMHWHRQHAEAVLARI